PIVFTSFWIERHAWGLWPGGFHFTNILLHAANAFFVFRILTYLRLPGALAAAAVFAVHPVHVESVAWITERKNVLSALFYLAALLCYLRFDDTTNWKFYLLALAAFAAALLSKTVTCSLPVILLFIRWWRQRPIGVREIARIIPFLLLGLAAARIT